MRNLFIFTILIAVLFAASYAHAESMSQAGPGRPLDVAEAPIHTFLASSAVSLTDTAQKIGTKPAGAHGVYMLASGALNYGGSDIVTGTNGGLPLTTGSTKYFNLRQDDTTPQIYVINLATGTNQKVQLYWVK